MTLGLQLLGTDLAWSFLPVQDVPTFFEGLKTYVGFTETSSAQLRQFHPLAQPHFASIVDDFYAAIEAHPGARGAITGGGAQIARLKRTLIHWLDGLLLGPHDESYYELRARIGRVHVQIGLSQQYMFVAMNRIRVQLFDVLQKHVDDRVSAGRIGTALNQIVDLELAIMLETYRADLLEKNRSAERLATIGHFAANIGHELRNPLGVVESSLYLVRQHLGEDATRAPQVAKHLDRIGTELKRANQTIADVLDLARNKPPKRRPTDLRALVESAVDAALLPSAVIFESTVPPDLVVMVDPDQLRQVLVNLITNACQAMQGRGRLWFEADPIADGGARLRVRDDGPGIPPADARRIFDALFTTKAKGSGLGLALCRRIMEGHGGAVELELAATGASFLLTIPAA
ncbi:MAG TPA: protoglobin domain-containing protein [Polyangia bacterium]|nr:protoglobin domain-containing protein [Polyangia bacterium]